MALNLSGIQTNFRKIFDRFRDLFQCGLITKTQREIEKFVINALIYAMNIIKSTKRHKDYFRKTFCWG